MTSATARRYWLAACVGAVLAPGSSAAFAQTPAVIVEYRGTSPEAGTGTPIVDAPAGAGITLVFRISNRSDVPQTVATRLDRPAGWQVLFENDRLDLPPRSSVIETVTLAVPRNAGAGSYPVALEVRAPASPAATRNTVLIHVGERRQLTLTWLDGPPYLATGEPGAFELLIANNGNRPETVTLDVTSLLGVPVRTSWREGLIAAGATRRVMVNRQAIRVREGVREMLSASVTADGMRPVVEAHLVFDVIPEGRAPDTGRMRLPSTFSFRTGTGRDPGFGSFIGAGTLDSRRTTTINFGFVARDRSHPLMFERDRNYLTITAPGASLAAGDQTWALSYLTENGHYGLGVGGRVDRRQWSAGGFVDTGRYDVTEGSQIGAFVGLRMGRVAFLSAQYLTRFAGDLRSARLADIGSLRLTLKPSSYVSAEIEAGAGLSAPGTGRAVSAQLAFTSRRVSLYGRRVRRDDTYPLRDRTGVINGAGVSVRPFGRLQLEGTLDGTSQIDDPTLDLSAPTRQRISRARVAWASVVSVSAARTEWTAPGQDWTAQWRRESVTAELHVPLGIAWLSPGFERGTEATPFYPETPYRLGWVQAGVRMGARSSADVRVEYGRGDAGVADRIARRVSFGAVLQPIEATRVTVRLNNGGRDALWLKGSQSVSAMFDLRLPWRHHVVLRYERRSGGGVFRRDDEAHRLEYVVPIGIPLRASDSGRVTVRFTDAETGKARSGVLVQINRQSRLTDRNGVVTFTGLKPGQYHVTVSPASLGAGHTVVPSMPLAVTVKDKGRVEVKAAIVRTGGIAGALQVFQLSQGLPAANQPPVVGPATGIAGALIELEVSGEHRMAVTDAQGSFAFDDVPPGTWRVRVVRADIPPFYALEQAQVTVTVAPGQVARTTLRVVPKLQ